MRAVLSKTVGGPSSLVVEEVLDPTPKAGEVVIEVKAVGVNFPDTLIIEDKYQFKPERPFSPGGEIAGVVEAVG
ncbi:MAG: alcohol dehydrogenase catalytic domain-containing protein, partial [Caulobacteraceae bacterium]|nr:alcohol dehydrogenase catalytic domain-containing protein [Caulobacteraceae bacterium]